MVIVAPTAVPAGRVIAEPVGLCDIPVTIADLLGPDADAPFPGRSLARYWRSDSEAKAAPSEPLLMETTKPILLTNGGREPAAKGLMRSLVAGGMHYIRSGDGSEELYALQSDPEERLNLAGAPMAREALERFRFDLADKVRKH
jgi:arylsulfatase A-like enzyme